MPRRESSASTREVEGIGSTFTFSSGMRADERTSLLSSDADEGRRCAGGDAKRTSALTWTLRGLATVAIVGCVAVVASSGLNEPALDRAHGSDANLGTAARGVVKNARAARISTGDARAWTVDATEARRQVVEPFADRVLTRLGIEEAKVVWVHLDMDVGVLRPLELRKLIKARAHDGGYRWRIEAKRLQAGAAP